MTHEEYKNKLNEIAKKYDKWYFKLPIIGERLKSKMIDMVKDECISLCNEFTRSVMREEWLNKTREEQYKTFENIATMVGDEIGYRSRVNWDEIIKSLK